MPRDNMASLIQRIARQACLTFRGCGEASIPPGFPENLSKLKSLLTQVRAEDLNIAPRKATLQPLPPNLPPVTYMHIYETHSFSLGVFLLKSALRHRPALAAWTSWRRGGGQRPLSPPPEQQFEPPLQARERETMRPGILRSRAEYTEASGLCVLTPHRDNLHQIDAVDGPAAFPGHLGPALRPRRRPDCHYYRC
uniref:2-aminoethanethiol dioxygenase n=1 Tax=Cavia porcellus TaxID=10141 RepID=H0W286_CAVPO